MGISPDASNHLLKPPPRFEVSPSPQQPAKPSRYLCVALPRRRFPTVRSPRASFASSRPLRFWHISCRPFPSDTCRAYFKFAFAHYGGALNHYEQIFWHSLIRAPVAPGVNASVLGQPLDEQLFSGASSKVSDARRFPKPESSRGAVLLFFMAVTRDVGDVLRFL